MNISYDAYRVFYQVARCRSFTRAAQELCSNQPNVTRTIKNLEHGLGCSLFVRSNRGVSLTAEGEKLYAHIGAAMEHIRAGEQELLSDAGLLSGVIRIGTSEIALHHTLLPVLEQFRKQYPGVRLRIFNSNTHQAVRVLKERLVDLSLVTTPFEEQRDLVCRTLAEFQDAAVCAGTYAHLAQRTITAAELTEYPLISLGKGTATHQLYTQWFHGHGLVLAPDIEAATADQILPMMRSNLGIGFVPEHTAQKAAADGEIYILNIRQPLPRRSICLLKRRDTPLSAAARALETMILQHCQGGKRHDQ